MVSDLWIRVFRRVILRFLLGFYKENLKFSGFKICFSVIFIRLRCFLRGFWRWALNCSLNWSQIWNFGFWWCLNLIFLNYFSCLWKLYFNFFFLKIWNLGGLFFLYIYNVFLKTLIYGMGTGWFFPCDSLLKCLFNSLRILLWFFCLYLLNLIFFLYVFCFFWHFDKMMWFW